MRNEEEMLEAQPLIPHTTTVRERMAHRRTVLFRCMWFLIAFTAGSFIAGIPQIIPNNPSARHALGIFVFACIMWATECLPLFATSLSLPILIVWLKVYNNSSTTTMAAAKQVMSSMMSGTFLVALGAFTISAALTKYQLSYRLAHLVLSRVGRNPKIVMAAVMFLALFLSMWISNVAAPLVCAALVGPMLQALPPEEPYVKTMVMAIAYASNIGGLTTPISSPQNLLGFSTINNPSGWSKPGDHVSSPLNWGLFLGVTVPFALICLVLAWTFLWLFYRPKLKEIDAIPSVTPSPIGIYHIIVIVVSLTTIVLWALETEIQTFTGDTGISALIPVVVFFGLRILDVEDFRGLAWDVLMLLAGGFALGNALNQSGLLGLIANSIAGHVSTSPTWVVFIAFSGFIWIFANFMSHTVAALVVIPIVCSVGCVLGAGDCVKGHYQLLSLGALIMDSTAMGLPVSSFPNAQMFALRDKNGRNYVTVSDFVFTGFPLGFLTVCLMLSLGYLLMQAFGL